ncbi:MAG: hypothetical protein M0Z87_07985, partial [Actinomycetota bacterium]|nr:hypothetical protein [Actinomycetota bacterium]
MEGFPVAEISEHLAEAANVVWLDLRDPDEADLAVLEEEFGLHPLAVEDAVQERQRPKLDRYRTHLFAGWPGGIAPPGSHRSRRDSLPSSGSSHPCSDPVNPL